MQMKIKDLKKKSFHAKNNRFWRPEKNGAEYFFAQAFIFGKKTEVQRKKFQLQKIFVF